MANLESGLSQEVSDALLQTDSYLWSGTPNYSEFDRKAVLRRMRLIEAAVGSVTGDYDYLGLTDAATATWEFVNGAFDEFEGKKRRPPIDWAFAAPGRTARGQDDRYAGEVTPFLPLLDPKYGVSADIRQRAIVGLAPSVIEQYQGDGDKTGAIIYTPLYQDMATDLTGLDRLTIPRKNVDHAARLARELGASLLGLGATIPKFTKSGTTINIEGLDTTTGHGGTVYLMEELREEAMRYVFSQNGHTPIEVGYIGAAGSIGGSAYEIAREELEGVRINIYDQRVDALQKIAQQHKATYVSKDILELLERSSVVMAAVTSDINLDEIDPERKLDLRGKVIVDDSQPGCFDRGQVEERGGILTWVVGQDTSQEGYLKRVGNYGFGRESGLAAPSFVWGCEGEVGALALLGHPELALREVVTPQQAREVGKVCMELGIRAAPFQSYGDMANSQCDADIAV